MAGGLRGETNVPPNIVQRMLPIMPSERLIQHEWAKHGTCSGLTGQKYFETIQNAFAEVRIPGEYQQPLEQVNVAPDDIRRRFLAANPGMSESAVRVGCSGRFLSEVRICPTKDLRTRPRALPRSAIVAATRRYDYAAGALGWKGGPEPGRGRWAAGCPSLHPAHD